MSHPHHPCTIMRVCVTM
ncbi:hypothetical protein E2C01_079570 [Portunus trituberculatus]|uniref:Uncharacterized protein n=1 Tax=Portunus trituberculatus TaxID=210409 RepID=A0A5B7IJW8_PORTR|nr:hypothetical protein [Portunus trituberculatus]